jgi:hypothetical protein
MRPSVQNFAKLTLNDADARAGPKVVSWLDAIAERWLSTPAGTSKTDEVIESSAKTYEDQRLQLCARQLGYFVHGNPSEAPIRC